MAVERQQSATGGGAAPLLPGCQRPTIGHIRAFGPRARSLAIAGTLVLAAVSLLVRSASAASGDPFTPSLSTLTDTTVAGNSPNLQIRLTKPQDSCDPDDLETVDNGSFLTCPVSKAYEEQDLKKLSLTLPSGLSADPNAAPKCDPEQPGPPTTQTLSEWYCQPGTKVGEISGLYGFCVTFDGQTANCGASPLVDRRESASIFGDVYMGKPGLGEQARLIVLAGLTTADVDFPHEIRVDASVTVDSHGKIATVADNIPDLHRILFAPQGYADYFFQIDELTITLFGNTGAGTGHPLVQNPTSCSGKQLEGQAEGWAENVDFVDNIWVAGHGDGTTVLISAPYYVTGCNQVPYAPNLAMSLDPPTPGAVPAITSTVSQAGGEQNTDSVSVKFPKGYKLNAQTGAGQCTDDQFASSSCPAESKIGTATAASPLLPIDSPPLTGDVFLGQTDLAAGNVKLMMKLVNDFLPSGIDVTGTSQLNVDGNLQANFTDVPDLPISSFTLALEGGDKGLVRNPTGCGTRTGEATFTSHQGKQVVTLPELAIACDEASLDVDVGTRRAKAHPTISMAVSAAGMQSLSFRLPSGLKVKRRPAAGKGYGTLDLVGEDGTTSTRLDLLRTSRTRKSALFSAVEGKAQVTSLVLRHKRANEVAVTSLPDGTVKATLELVGRKNNLLTNPSTCRQLRRTAKGKRKTTGERRDLNYSATITNIDGKTMTPTLRTSMACAKTKTKRSKRR